MFGNIERTIQQHAVARLVNQLARVNHTHVDGIGHFTYEPRLKQVHFQASEALVKQIEEARSGRQTP